MDPLAPSSAPLFQVRRAGPDDLHGMARVHIETWKTTYRGLIDDDRLDQMTVEGDIAGGFGSWLRNPPAGVAQFVAATPMEGVVGFALGLPNPEEGSEFSGQLGAIYVLRAHQGRGIGRALVGAVSRHLLSLGKETMIVWVLDGNPYRRFYERLGGTVVGKRTSAGRLSGGVTEVSYGWSDIRPLTTLGTE
jgi:GNAT superfamily N-acetyltransferase